MKKFWFIVFIFISIFILAACTQENEEDTEEDEKEKTTPVEVTKATKDDFMVDKSVFGRTAPSTTIPVAVQNPGEIDSVDVKNGDIVNENEQIATVDTPMGVQTVKAPTDGEIANLKTEGAMATAEEPIAMIIDTENMHITFSVTANVHKLMNLEEKWPVYISGDEYEAEIISKSTLPDDTGLYTIKASVDNQEATILAGTVAELHVTEKVFESTVIVPTAALVEEGEDVFVYVVKDNEAVKTIVEVEETQTDRSAITGKVAEGDQVVISGQLTLSDQSKVEVVKEGKSS